MKKYMTNMMNKKAQLTIFIIIGIVLLFSAALVTFIRQSVVLYKPPVEVAETVATELQPIQKYVTECLSIVAKEGIRTAGMQGGYIDASKFIVNDADPTSGEGISMSPGSAIKVPYWHYMRSQNICEAACEFSSKIPALYRTIARGNSLEEQIDKYVQEKLSSCLRGFVSFKPQGFEFEESQIKATTTITKTDVFVQAEYPLKITKGGTVQTISKFSVKLPIILAKYYDLAVEITKKEAESNFLGFLALNLIDMYSGVDENRLPPVADVTFKRGESVSWTNDEVKAKVEEILMSHTSGLQVQGTSNFEGNYYQGENALSGGVYSLFVVPSDNTFASNAEFSYLAWWPVYLSITPGRGSIIAPDSRSGFSSFMSTFGLNSYKFAYDLSYPVLITLTDPSAFDGEGFTFQFALESNIRNNAMMKVDAAALGTITSPVQTYVCDPSNYNSDEITITVSDSITKAPLGDAQIYFSFGKESCFIGNTELVSLQEASAITGQAAADTSRKAILTSRMPVGIGSLAVFKEGYMSKTTPFGVLLDEKQDKEIALDRFVKINVSAKLAPFSKKVSGLNINDYAWTPTGTFDDLASTNQAVITFSRIPETKDSEQYAVAVEFLGTKERTKEIELVPGDYNIVATLLDNQITIVPEAEECFDDDWYDQFGLGKQKCEKIDAITFDRFPMGGIEFNSFSISAENLNGAKELAMYLISVPSGYIRDANGVTNLKHKDLEEAGKFGDYSLSYESLITPEFRK